MVKTTGCSHATSGVWHGFDACVERVATQGLRVAGTAQRNGFTGGPANAFRTSYSITAFGGTGELRSRVNFSPHWEFLPSGFICGRRSTRGYLMDRTLFFLPVG